MLRSIRTLQGSPVKAADGEIGSVQTLYFDDARWTIRYLVVDTGGWLSGRAVLISPMAIESVDWHGRRVSVRLTREQVRDSPDIVSDLPVSRQQEAVYAAYYRWPAYWSGPEIWGNWSTPHALAAAASAAASVEDETAEEPSGDPHLRSAKEVIGYHIQATDDEVGRVDDLLVDDETWEIRYLVVATGAWWSGKKFLAAPKWVERVSWPDQKVYLDLARATIKGAPEWDGAVEVSPEFDAKLQAYYRRHWRGRPAPERGAGAAGPRVRAADDEPRLRAEGLIGKDVITIADGAVVGQVLELRIDPERRAVAGLVAALAAGDEAVTVVSAEALAAWGNDSRLQAYPTVADLRRPVLNRSGDEVGTVADVEFGARSGALTALVLAPAPAHRQYAGDELVVPMAKVITLGDVHVIVADEVLAGVAPPVAAQESST